VLPCAAPRRRPVRSVTCGLTDTYLIKLPLCPKSPINLKPFRDGFKRESSASYDAQLRTQPRMPFAGLWRQETPGANGKDSGARRLARPPAATPCAALHRVCVRGRGLATQLGAVAAGAPEAPARAAETP